MSHHTRTVILLVILIILVILGWVWYANTNNATPTTTVLQAISQTPNQPAASADAGLTTAPGDTSDAAIQADLNSVDAQMKGL